MTDNKNNKSHDKAFNLPDYIQIPLFLYKDKRLDKDHMLFTAWIYSLHTSGKTIKVKNPYLCELLSIKERQLYYVMDEVEKFGYIKRMGAGCSRKIVWCFEVNSNIEIEDKLHNPAQSCSVGQESHNPAQLCTPTLHNCAPQPCTTVHPYNNNYNNIYKRESSSIDLVSNPVINFLEPKLIAQQSKFNIECLEDDKCKQIFDSRFKGLEVTLEEILFECVMYYVMKASPMMVSPHRFRQWLKRERTDIYDKKPESAAHKLWRDLSEDERHLISDYNHFKKYPDIMGSMPEDKQRKAKELLEMLQQTQFIRSI